MPRMQLGYVNVTVADLDRSVRFFSESLGFPVKFADSEFGYAAFDTPGAGFAVAVAARGAEVGRHTGIGFTVADLDSAYAELQEKGVAFTRPPTREPWGGYMAMFADPDGNTYYLDQVDVAHG